MERLYLWISNTNESKHHGVMMICITWSQLLRFGWFIPRMSFNIWLVINGTWEVYPQNKPSTLEIDSPLPYLLLKLSITNSLNALTLVSSRNSHKGVLVVSLGSSSSVSTDQLNCSFMQGGSLGTSNWDWLLLCLIFGGKWIVGLETTPIHKIKL